MKRITIFAHFDKQNIIDDYVIDYLKELRKYSEIIFVSDGDLKEIETEKIKDLCFDYICKKHEEYDFGSYKRGFKLIKGKYPKKLQEIDELLFVNDSCYLIGSFGNIFADMEKKLDCDYWGLTSDYNNLNKDIAYYIGTFFITFRKGVFLAEFFHSFLFSVKKLQGNLEVIKHYEIGLSKILQENNKKSFCCFSRNEIGNYIVQNHLRYMHHISRMFALNTGLSKSVIYKYLNNIFNINTANYLHSNKTYFFIYNKFPLLKRRIIIYEHFSKEKLLFLWQEMMLEINPKLLKQIFNHANRIGLKLKEKKHIKNNIFMCFYFLRSYKLFYCRTKFKKGKRVRIVKLLFFKMKY